MAEYITRFDSMAQAVDVYVNMATATDGSTPGGINIPVGFNKIAQLITAVVVDGAVTVDISGSVTLKFRGKAMVQGDQEINIGGITGTEVGTSVGNSLIIRGSDIMNVSMFVKPTEDLFIDAAIHGTDLGTPFVGVTIVLVRS